MDFRNLSDHTKVFTAMPGPNALVLPNEPEFTVVASTIDFAEFAGAAVEELIGKSLFTFFPDNPDAPNVSNDIRSSLAVCLSTKKKNELPVQRYDISDSNGNFYEMYWKVIHTPILDDDGTIAYIIHTAIDVTHSILAGIKDARIKSLEPAHNLFMQTEMAIQIFKGSDAIIELANEPALKIWNRESSIIGQPLLLALPELQQQDFVKHLERVRTTGIPHNAHEAAILFKDENREGKRYFNYMLQPFYEEEASRPSGVIAMINEVSSIIEDRKALAEKERSLELAVEIGGLGFFRVDLHQENLNYSPQLMQWFDLPDRNQPLKAFLGRVHYEDFDKVKDVFKKSFSSELTKHDITFRIPRKDASDLIYLRSVGEVQNIDGQAILTGIVQDITSSVKSRMALESSAQRLKSVIESAPFPIGVYIGKEMRIEMANQAIIDAWGRSDVIGKNYAEVLPELEGQGIYEQLDHVFTYGVPFHSSNQPIDLMVDGQLKTFYFNYSFTPLFDADGSVYGVMNTAADVTDLNLAKQKVEQSERNFRNIILQAPVAMCLLRGPSFVVGIANKFITALWHKDTAEIIGKPIFEAVPEAANQGIESLLQKAYTSGETVTAEELPVRFQRHGDSKLIYQNFVCEPYRDVEGNILGVLVISLDVTPQVQARHKIEEVVGERTQALEHANRMLQKSNAELEQFAYIASHDLQEPLRKIGLFTQMLQNSMTQSTPQELQYMERISNAANRMMNLIRDILNYSQLAREANFFTKTDLEETLGETLAEFEMILIEKGGRIDHSPLPQIDAIPSQMLQLFNNLVSNSIKYSRADIPPVITITYSGLPVSEADALGLPPRPDGYCQISFKDNGIGFPQDYAAKIFNIFQRLHGKLDYEGTGIGLAMCKKIADNHHGAIFARGSEGEGAEFVVILPVSQEM